MGVRRRRLGDSWVCFTNCNSIDLCRVDGLLPWRLFRRGSCRCAAKPRPSMPGVFWSDTKHTSYGLPPRHFKRFI